MTPRQETRRRVATVAAGTAAVVVVAVATATQALFHRMERPVPPPVAIDAGLIELPPASVAAAPLQPEPASPPSPSAPLRQAPALPKPQEARRHPPTHAVERKADDAAPPARPPSPPAENPASPPPAAETPRKEEMAGGNGAARAIVQPAPVIPPELRHHLLAFEAVVRFTIAADGSATASLEEATPDPRINRILLDAFRRWRFFPALQEGRPTASTLVLRVPVRVE